MTTSNLNLELYFKLLDRVYQHLKSKKTYHVSTPTISIDSDFEVEVSIEVSHCGCCSPDTEFYLCADLDVFGVELIKAVNKYFQEQTANDDG